MMATMAFTVSAAKPEDFDDFPSESYWATPALKAALANNILYGKGDGIIDSKANLTRAEMAAIITRAFGADMKSDVSAYGDLDPQMWYYDVFAKAVRMGVFSGDENGNMNPESPITREEAFTVFARAMVLSDNDTSVLNKFADANDISTWAKSYLSPLVKKGYINGNEANMITPKANITRAEFAQFMHNMFKTYYSAAGTYETAGANSAMINTKDVNLKGITVEDDLVIGDGADLSEINLTDVTIKGRLLVRGAATVRLTNVTTGEGVVVNNVNATVHFDNYRTEKVFDGINMITPATFKEDYTIVIDGPNKGSGSSSTPVYDYYIRYLTQTLDLTGYELVKTETSRGKSGASVTAPIPERRGFTYNPSLSTISGKVNKSGLILEVYYDRNSYTVTFNSGGGSDVPSVTKVYGEKIGMLPTPVKAGNDFLGWYLTDGVTKIDEDTTITKDVTFVAHWSEKQANYAVKYYKQKVDLSGYDEVTADSTTITGAVGATVTAPDKAYTGFELDNTQSVKSGVILEDGSLVLKLYYNRLIYNVTFDAAGGTVLAGSSLDAQRIPYEGNVVLPVVTKAGYGFVGWFNGTNKITDSTPVTENMNLVAKWDKTEAQYTVKYYKQKVDLSGYDEVTADSVSPTGTIGATVTAPDKAYTGFELDNTQSVKSGVILEDGSLVLKLYYNRLIYNVTFDAAGGTVLAGSSLDAQRIPYEGNVVLPSVTKTGHSFAGWFNGATKVTASTPVTADMNLVAKWDPIPATKAQYAIEYYKQKSDLSGYEKVTEDCVTITDTIGKTVTAPDKAYPGYTLNDTMSVKSGEILSDGSLVLKMYYDINTFTVTFKEGTRVLGTATVAQNTTVSASDIPETTKEYKGFKKDASVSSLYASSDWQYKAKFRWWYNPTSATWEEFTDATVVTQDMTVYSTSQKVSLNLYVDKIGKSLTFGTYYAPDTRLFDAINEVISQTTTLKAIKDTGYYDKAINKMKEYKLIDDSNNILMQEILAKFSMIIGESNLEKYIVDNAKEMFTTSSRLRNSIVEYIKLQASSGDAAKVSDVKALIEKVLEFAVNNTTTGLSQVKATFKDMMETDDSFFEYVTGYDPSTLSPAQKDAIVDAIITEFETNPSKQTECIEKASSFIVKSSHISRIDAYVDYALDYLNTDTDLRDKVVNDIIDTMYRATLDKLLDEVKNKKQFEVNADNSFIAEGLKKKILEFTFDELKKEVPAKLFEIYPEAKMKEIFEDASQRILDQVNTALTNADAGITTFVDTGYTFIINPVSDIYIPLYDRAVEIIKAKNFRYSENAYLREIIGLLDVSNLFDGSENAKPNTLSGYTLKDIDDYYDLVKKISILTDDALVWYNRNLDQAQIDKVVDNYHDFILKYVNMAADMLDDYAKNGTIPSKVDNKFVRAFEDAVKKKFPSLVNKLVNWYKTSPINKDYTDEDYAKLKEAIDFAFNNVDITVNEFFDNVLAKKFSKYQTAKDTYSKEYKNNKVTVYREIQK